MKAQLNTLSFLFLSVTLLNSVHAATYELVKDYTSNGPAGFFDSFNFFSQPDPTHGYVRYLDQMNAISTGLVGYTAPTVPADLLSTQARTSPDSVYIGVDYNSTASVTGRASIRISSHETYNPGTLLVADIAHLPSGCGTWPALWMLGTSNPWPNAGELDIIEQVNLATTDSVTLHTSSGCAVDPSDNSFTGTLATSDCDVNAPDQAENAGCSITAPKNTNTFGKPFNTNGGGVYIVEWKDTAPGGFTVWFFPRNNLPSSLRNAGQRDSSTVQDTRDFGTPLARFQGGGCDWDTHFQDMQIIFNVALCGDWAGDDWTAGGCATSTGVPTCEQYVAQNPAAFINAYWEIAGLSVYSSAASSSSAPHATGQVYKRSIDVMDSVHVPRNVTPPASGAARSSSLRLGGGSWAMMIMAVGSVISVMQII